MKIRAKTLIYTGKPGKPFLNSGEVADVKASIAKALLEREVVEAVDTPKDEPEKKPEKPPRKGRGKKNAETDAPAADEQDAEAEAAGDEKAQAEAE